MKTYLETARLIVVYPEPAHFKDWFKLQSDPDVMRYISGKPRTHEEVEYYFTKNLLHLKKHGFCVGSVFEKASDQFIGRAGLIFLGYDDAQPEIEIAYSLYKTFWCRGYATELARAFIEWGFKNLKINRLIAISNPENIKSWQVMIKVGIDHAGKMQHHGVEVVRYEIFNPIARSNSNH